MNNSDFFSEYLSYTSGGECPAFFHRWSAITGIGAYLGRQFNFFLGSHQLNTNIYCMLMGSAGTRKSSGIREIKSLLRAANYNTFSSEKTTKEKFILDLAGDSEDVESDIDRQLFGVNGTSEASEIFIAADEFNDFFGNGNMEFVSLLGQLWDYNGVYKNRIKNGKSVEINDPTISILGGNTQTGFANAFPPDIIGQGFFSRIILVHADKTDKKVAFPVKPDHKVTEALVNYIKEIKQNVFGEAQLTPTARKLLTYIYETWERIEDDRFESYGNRRFVHLLKLCLIHSAARLSNTIEEADVIYANTVLTFTEHLMPRALGEFGRSERSNLANKVMNLLLTTNKPLTYQDIHARLNFDVSKQAELTDVIRNLTLAGKAQATSIGFLPIRKVIKEVDDGSVNFNLLSKEEREMKR